MVRHGITAGVKGVPALLAPIKQPEGVRLLASKLQFQVRVVDARARRLVDSREAMA